MTPQHQYAVGDSVRYLSSTKADYRAPGTYRIVRLRPNEGSDQQYWVRSALENFDRIASESELALIRPKPDTRVTRRQVTISQPFQLKGMEQERPAGEYEVTTTEEVVGDFVFEAYRRVSTIIYLPPRSNDYGVGIFIETDPAELEQVTNPHPKPLGQ
jgi:hypothetical protein